MEARFHLEHKQASTFETFTHSFPYKTTFKTTNTPTDLSLKQPTTTNTITPLIPKTQTKTHNTKFSSPTKLSCKNLKFEEPKTKKNSNLQ